MRWASSFLRLVGSLVFVVAPCQAGDEPDQPALVISTSPSFRSRLRSRSVSPASSANLQRQQSWLSRDGRPVSVREPEGEDALEFSQI